MLFRSASVYDTLERSIVPMFYREPDRFADVMLHAIAFNGSFFNTQRMLHEYVSKAYLGKGAATAATGAATPTAAT